MGNSARSALLIIDVQQGLDDPCWGQRNNPEAEDNIVALLSAWRAARRPVIHVQHMSTRPDSPLRQEKPGNALKPEVEPAEGEPIFRKNVHSAFIGTDLEEYLRRRGIEELIVVGLTTDHCVSTTVRMAANLSFDVKVVSDATATFERTGPEGDRFTAEEMHRSTLTSLHEEFAEIVNTADVLDDLL
ncbi:MAG: cysteine hydrolase family protein [Rhodothermales bacterium]|nr:cysteine hydrolase family protein [Rhodothermales bacterium]